VAGLFSSTIKIIFILQAYVILTIITRRQELKNKLYLVWVMQSNNTRNINKIHYEKSLCLIMPKIPTFFGSHSHQGLYEQVWKDL
jgi:hypothetical protein